MNNGISGYDASRINRYGQLDSIQQSGSRAPQTSHVDAQDQTRAAEPPPLGPGLSDEEAGMIHKQFPDSEQMKLKLYGPGSQERSINPNAVGRRLDLLG